MWGFGVLGNGYKRVFTRKKDAEKLGVPLIIREFGACHDIEVCVREINQVGDTLNKD